MQSSTPCQQPFLSQPLSQPQFFFTAKLCPNWIKPPLVSPHHQQTQPHGNHQSLLSTDLTSMQNQANIARESSVDICFTLGTSWSMANTFNGQFHFWSWDALLKPLCGQMDFCSQYSALQNLYCWCWNVYCATYLCSNLNFISKHFISLVPAFQDYCFSGNLWSYPAGI